VVSGRQGGFGIVLVEAKSHESELRSPSSKASGESSRIIDAALSETKLALGVPDDAPWAQSYYQVANRLAFLYWLRQRAKRQAWLVNVYFLGDCFTSGAAEIAGPADRAGWAETIAHAKRTLQIPPVHALSPWAIDLFLPAEPGSRRAS
jgi:hypothetical protein